MKLNKKGFTLIELLGVIAILAVIVGVSSFGIVSAIKSSKAKALDLTLDGILASASTYALEQGDSAWHNINDYNYSYYCVTIEELINKGLIENNSKTIKQLTDNNISLSNYMIIKKNKVTLDILGGNKKDIKDSAYTQSDAYKICNGNIRNEQLKSPELKGAQNYTDTLVISYNEGEITDKGGKEDEIIKYTCYYGENSNNLDKSTLANTSNNSCTINDLKQSQNYYIRVCMDTSRGGTSCSSTQGYKTLEIKPPVIEKTERQVAEINYDDTGILGKAYHYFKSTKDGTASNDVKICVYENNKYECSDTTKNIQKNTWYLLIEGKKINLTYPNGTKEVTVTAETRDKSDNFKSVSKTIDIFDVYQAVFHKGNASKIGESSSDITLSCTEKDTRDCIVKSPSITPPQGYSTIGWNQNESATSSEVNPNSNVTLTSNTNYYAIIKNNTYTITYNANGGSGAPSPQTAIYGQTLKLNDTKPIKTGYAFAGWKDPAGAIWAAGWIGTWTFVNGQHGISNNTLNLTAQWTYAPINRYICNSSSNRMEVFYTTGISGSNYTFNRKNGLTSSDSFTLDTIGNRNWIIAQNSVTDNMNSSSMKDCEYDLWACNSGNPIPCLSAAKEGSSQVRTIEHGSLITSHRTTTKVDDYNNWYYSWGNNCYINGQYLQNSCGGSNTGESGSGNPSSAKKCSNDFCEANTGLKYSYPIYDTGEIGTSNSGGREIGCQCAQRPGGRHGSGLIIPIYWN